MEVVAHLCRYEAQSGVADFAACIQSRIFPGQVSIRCAAQGLCLKVFSVLRILRPSPYQLICQAISTLLFFFTSSGLHQREPGTSRPASRSFKRLTLLP